MLEIYTPPKNNSKSTTTFKETVKKESLEKKKIILHLIFKYLIENNLHSVAQTLQNETQAGIYYQVCENIDMEIILQEYQSYYYTKFQKNPKIIRKNAENESQIIQARKERKSATKEPQKVADEQYFNINITPLSQQASDTEKIPIDYDNHSSEWKEMAEQIIKQIVPKKSQFSFSDCVSLNSTIETLKEAVIYPFMYPQLFQNICHYKGVLLYGPPGTGKTLLAKALAHETTLINVSSSTLISKWRGESEKLVKVLFDVAKHYSPCTIFIDEIDALASTTIESSHEAFRRFKSELLTQMDGIIENNVFVLASTNNPWNIDNALLRRFEKRILVPLPDKESRAEILKHYLKKNGDSFIKCEIEAFVEWTENFTGSDLKNVCKEIQMMVVREKLQQIQKNGKINVTKKVTSSEVLQIIQNIKPCIDNVSYTKYVQWTNKYGTV